MVVPPGTPRERLHLPTGRRTLRVLLADLLTTAAGAVARLALPRLLLELVVTDGEGCVLLHDHGPGMQVGQGPRSLADAAKPGEPAPRYRLGSVRRTVEEGLHGRIEIAAPRLGGASFRLTLPGAVPDKAHEAA